MKRLLLCTAALSLLLLAPAPAQADEASQRKAVEQIFTTMDMEKVFNQSIDQMLQMQVQQNPAIAKFMPQMKAFLSKYMSWESMKQDMTKLYMEEFSEEELNELNKFYSTPVGKKTIQKMPGLMAKGAAMGQQRVQEHMAELQAAIGEASKGGQ